MRKKGGFLLGMALLCGLALILGGVVVLAQGSSAVEWWVVSSGGGPSTSAGVALNDTLGQPIIGASSGGNVTLGAGYWYGLGYVINTYVITPTAGAGGSITPDTPQTVSYGGSITFTIAPNVGYHIADVGVDGVSQGALESHTFTNVTADHTITAVFAINTYTITPTAGAGGSITPGTPQTVSYGGSLTFTIAPNVGYHIADVGVDGVSQGALESHTFSNVTADHTITAAFALNCQAVQSPTFAFAPLRPLVGETVWFTGTVAAGSGPLTYTWAWGDGMAGGLGATLSHAFPLTTTTRTYTVSLSVSNACSGPDVVAQAVTVTPRRVYLPVVLRQ